MAFANSLILKGGYVAANELRHNFSRRRNANSLILQGGYVAALPQRGRR